ncbi:hypothetical protein HOP50_15g75230 [Chloropicon primus]|uniref:PLAC8 domain-containing protein n=1 Tax=Chloropicon primus TaxID=1764295 RepID=A0A5B8MZP2_9CHLO|nr:hypothetical protein A3770_15p74980 [Chloropicon primus]UPR04189.1 hypothetical protein HOP50_15g75230 [Chloropicon primus]|eukprot:QDZ24980.1 hypothetical protein A3770_15p74980 [Chloropicon primus]
MATVTTVGGNNNNQMDLWQATLCGCFDDCSSCCLTTFCACCQYGRNVEATTGNGCFVPCLTYFCLLLWFPPAIPCVLSSNRTTMRQSFNLPAQPCDDCCTYCFCGSCALCQEARELKLRGANASNPAIQKLRQANQTQMVVVTQAPQVVAAPQASAPVQGEPAPVFKV